MKPKVYSNLEKQDLIRRLIERAIFSSIDRNKPGALIKRLNENDKEIVKELTSIDFYHRIPKVDK